jgi:hypothetical protein
MYAFALAQEEKKRKLLKVRLEMAKFLQETIRESGIRNQTKIKESETFKEFFRKVCRQILLSLRRTKLSKRIVGTINW